MSKYLISKNTEIRIAFECENSKYERYCTTYCDPEDIVKILKEIKTNKLKVTKTYLADNYGRKLEKINGEE